MYRCEAVSAEAFVQQLACNLVNHGYWFYTVGHVPPGKDPRAVDRKLIEGYGLEISKWQRARLKAKGHAKLSYLLSVISSNAASDYRIKCHQS
jgi:hypothetical protein